MAFLAGVSPEPLSASGRSSEKLSIPSLQSKMKLTRKAVKRSSISSTTDPIQLSSSSSSKRLSTSLLSVASMRTQPWHRTSAVVPYSWRTSQSQAARRFPSDLAAFLKSSARTLPSGLRFHVSQSLILLVNRKIIDIKDTLSLFTELQILGDRNLKKLAFSHVVHSLRRMNTNYIDGTKNRVLQNNLFALLQQEDEGRAKKSLINLCELHRRKNNDCCTFVSP